MTEEDQKILLYRSYINSIEDFVQLKVDFDVSKTRDYCHKYRNLFFEYHKNSTYDQRRTALAITNQTGEDDDSSFVSLRGTNLNEMSFTKKTKHYYDSGLSPLLDMFGDALGRTHILHARMGGFFKPHRDGPKMESPSTECVRILLCIDKCNPYEMHFILGNSQVLPLQTGNCYYINTMKTHSQISFHDDCFFLIANVQITKEMIKLFDDISARP